MIMRLGGGAPLSERQRAERAFPSSVQATTGQAIIHDYGIQTGNRLPISRAAKCKPANMPWVRPCRRVKAMKPCVEESGIGNPKQAC